VYLCPEEAGGEHSDSHGTGCSSSEEESRSSFSTSEGGMSVLGEILLVVSEDWQILKQ